MDTPASRTWFLYFVQELPIPGDDDLLLRALRSLDCARLDSGRIGTPFLLDQYGDPHTAFNAFFAGGRMRNRAPSTNRKYAHALRVWMNFLAARDKDWDSAVEDDVMDFKFWRRSDPRNPRRVSGSAWASDLAALAMFYDWAARVLGGPSLVAAAEAGGVRMASAGGRARAADLRPSTIRGADVK